MGAVQIDDNGTQIMIIDDFYGYIYTISTGVLIRITDTDFPTPSSLFQIDGYFFVTQKGSGRFYSSALRDGTSWNALHYNNAEGDSDNLVGGAAVAREAWLIGDKSTEVWYNAGSESGTPLQRRGGVFIHYGGAAKNTICRVDNGLFWLATNKNGGLFVLRSSGYQVERVSDHGVEKAMEGMSTVSDARAYAYAEEGHIFYVMVFPTGNQTWAYDLSTGYWHKRESKEGDEWGRHRSNCHAYFNGNHYVGDHSNGKIYEMSLSHYDDDGTDFRSVWTTISFRDDQKNIFYHRFQAVLEPGVGLVSGHGSDPQAMLKYSDDNGHTWSNELWTDIGQIGEYSSRAMWWGLGSGRNRIFKLTISDPVKRVLDEAHIDLEVGTS
jgi:hypothetical protein